MKRKKKCKKCNGLGLATRGITVTGICCNCNGKGVTKEEEK